MTVTNREQAWKEADKVFPTDYEKDLEASRRAGYDIYRHPTLNSNSRICDTGDRLEVLTGEHGEDITYIWIAPELVYGMGTNMEEREYKRLCDRNDTQSLTAPEAILLINREFGFEASRIEIVNEAAIFAKSGKAVEVYESFARTPQYCTVDYNYVRFNVRGWQYEMVNGKLCFYYD